MVLLMAHHEYYLVQRKKKNAVVLAAEVVDSLLWVERHSGTVTGLPPKERLQKRIHGSNRHLWGSMCTACLFSPVEEFFCKLNEDQSG